MDLATLTNAPRDFTLDGETYKVSALVLREWGEIQGWIKHKVPGPVAQLDSSDMNNLSPAHQRQLLEIALREQRAWPPRVGSAAWFDTLDREGGGAAFLKVVLGKHRPGFTAEQAAALADRLGTAEVIPLILAALGFEGGPDRPKADGPATEPDPATAPA